jgi:predicted enzyme related to lactoylglutathione lyase
MSEAEHRIRVSQMRLVVEADDLDGAVAFYRDVLALSPERDVLGESGARVVILSAGRATLELVNPAQKHLIDEAEVGRPVSPRLRVAFQVDDAARATGVLTAAGGELLAAPVETPWRSLNSRLAAPAGLQITLFQELDRLEAGPQVPADLAGAAFDEVDMSGASFREVDLSRTLMRGVMLADADIDGYIPGLRINGVDVAPLVEAELDRLHPERISLRATDVEGLRAGWEAVERFWEQTMERAARLPEAELSRSVGGEWSFAETLRHLVFVTDAWLGHAVLGEDRPFHPIGLPATFITDGEAFGIDSDAAPTFGEVMAARAGRIARVREFLAAMRPEDVDRLCRPNAAPGWPPPAQRTVVSCLHVVFSEEWAHHQFAIRDLAVIEGGG